MNEEHDVHVNRDVFRWTAQSAQTVENGAWVLYGDYLDLLNRFEDAQAKYYRDGFNEGRVVGRMEAVAQSIELFEAAKAFYNATIADVEVIVRTPSAEKQEFVQGLADRLRALLERGLSAGGHGDAAIAEGS